MGAQSSPARPIRPKYFPNTIALTANGRQKNLSPSGVFVVQLGEPSFSGTDPKPGRRFASFHPLGAAHAVWLHRMQKQRWPPPMKARQLLAPWPIRQSSGRAAAAGVVARQHLLSRRSLCRRRAPPREKSHGRSDRFDSDTSSVSLPSCPVVAPLLEYKHFGVELTSIMIQLGNRFATVSDAVDRPLCVTVPQRSASDAIAATRGPVALSG
jgi:hypothetical protein